jgi:hypothetical protein
MAEMFCGQNVGFSLDGFSCGKQYWFQYGYNVLWLKMLILARIDFIKRKKNA